ncbi:MAG TPA: amidohydrolase family protein [Gemmatimonadales bacterium]
MTAVRLSADWLVPIVGPPVRDGAVLVGEDGRIAAAGPDSAVPAPPGIPAHRHPGVILPGLVNAHTHLELTGWRDVAPPDDFPTWIRTIRRRKEARTAAEYLDAARAGLRACWAGGVTTIADTGDSGAVIEALAEAGGSGVAYQEVFGPDPGQLADSMTGLKARVTSLTRFEGPRIRLGVSPHAPYTVSGPLFRAVADFADQDDLPLAVHVAESGAEQQLIAASAGPFAEAWAARGIPLPDSLAQLDQPLPIRTPVRWLDALGVLGPTTLAIHAVRIDPEDVHILARHDVAVAHCPVSNARHAHGEAPLRALLAAGIRVGLGTDSEASVGPLDLFAEMRAARRIGGLSAEETLRLATLEGALAIGAADVGAVAEGYWADLTLVGRADGQAGRRAVEDPNELLVNAAPGDVAVTWQAGNVVFRR